MQRWRCVRIWLDRAQQEPVTALLLRYDPIGLEERGPEGDPLPVRQPWDPSPAPPPSPRLELRAWFPVEGPELPAVSPLQKALEGVPNLRWHEEIISEGDWEERWRTDSPPLTFGEDLVVAAPWAAPDGALQIEPAMAFGTGHHPTTAACLEVLCAHTRPGESLLDVGCGSGILTLAACRRGVKARGIDTDPEAVRAARANATLNHLSPSFETTPLDRVPGRYHWVVANIYAEILVVLADALVARAHHRLLLSGILDDRIRLVDAAFPTLEILEERREERWVTRLYKAP